MSNNTCENGFGATMRSTSFTVEYEDKLMMFQVFEKWRKLVYLRNVKIAGEMIDAVKLLYLCYLHN